MKQHNQTHRSFTEVRLSSKRGIQHLNLGCKILAFYKMSQVSTSFIYRKNERNDRINILPLGANNKLNIYSTKNKHRNHKLDIWVRQHFLACTGTDSRFLTPVWISFFLSSLWPVIVSFFSSLELVCELFAMPVYPDRSSEEAR